MTAHVLEVLGWEIGACVIPVDTTICVVVSFLSGSTTDVVVVVFAVVDVVVVHGSS